MKKFNEKRVKYISIINKVISFIYHTPKCNIPLNWNNIHSVLIIDFTGIGDAVMLIPVLKHINQIKSIQIDLICNPYVKPLLDDQRIVDKFILFDGLNKLNRVKDWIINLKDIKEIINITKKKKYDLILEPRGDLRHIFFMHFLLGEIKASYDYTKGEGLLNCYIKHNENIEHLVDDKLYFLEQLGIEINSNLRVPSLIIPNNVTDDLRKKISDKKVIGIHPGASNPKRIWPFYDKLIENLCKKISNVCIMVFVGPKEKTYISNLLKKIDAMNIDYFISETGIKEYRNRISICNLFICNDSGAAHIAGAEGILTFSIFGASDPNVSRPLNPNVYSLENGKYTCQRTMDSVKVEEVERMIMEKWKYEK